MRLPLLRYVTIAFATTGTMACTSRTPQKDLETLRSWRASAELADSGAREGWIPGRYVSQVRDRAQSALNAMRADPAPKPTAEERNALAESERALQAAIDRLTARAPR